MKFSRRCTVLLGMAIMSPALLFAQFDPMATSDVPDPAKPASAAPTPRALQDSGPNSGDVGQVMQDKMFLRKAAEGGIAEVKLGQLAAKKGSSDDVKAFAQKMVDDHTKLNNRDCQRRRHAGSHAAKGDEQRGPGRVRQAQRAIGQRLRHRIPDLHGEGPPQGSSRVPHRGGQP